jgi:hypothetical protein
MCEAFLANTVIESYSVELEQLGGSGGGASEAPQSTA